MPGSQTVVASSTCSNGVEKGVYKGTGSSFILIPPTGITFSYESCCRPGWVDNLTNSGGQLFLIEAKYFPGGGDSPRFLINPTITGSTGINQYFNNAAYDPDAGDSVYVTFGKAKGGTQAAPLVLAYDSGYAYNKPFGLNVSTSLDSLTGLLSVNSSAPTGM